MAVAIRGVRWPIRRIRDGVAAWVLVSPSRPVPTAIPGIAAGLPAASLQGCQTLSAEKITLPDPASYVKPIRHNRQACSESRFTSSPSQYRFCKSAGGIETAVIECYRGVSIKGMEAQSLLAFAWRIWERWFNASWITPQASSSKGAWASRGKNVRSASKSLESGSHFCATAFNTRKAIFITSRIVGIS